MKTALFLFFLGLAAAVPSNSGLHHRENTIATSTVTPTARSAKVSTRRLLVGAPGKILAVDYDSEGAFSLAARTPFLEGSSFSWLVYREDLNMVYAVNENHNQIHPFKYDPSGGLDGMLTAQPTVPAAQGIVHLEMSRDGSRMLASSYGEGIVQVWDTTSTDGSISFLANLTSDDILGPHPTRQDAPHPHQAVRHPNRDFFVVNDLGTDTLLVIDGQDEDDYKISNTQLVPPMCGPRHGVFTKPMNESEYTHYTVLCEISSEVLSYTLDYSNNNIDFYPADRLYTREPPTGDFAAGELIVYGNHMYASNRDTDQDEDTITHLDTINGMLHFQGEFSSGAKKPRMMSLSEDGRVLFVANQEDSQSLYAFPRTPDGTVNDELATHADLSGELEDGGDSTGPMFVLEISTA